MMSQSGDITPSYPYIENIPYINYNEGCLMIMWDKKRGETKYDHRNDVLCLDPYIIKKKSKEGKYYLYTMSERRISPPVDESLLRPYIKIT
jgi:hypothetical protein